MGIHPVPVNILPPIPSNSHLSIEARIIGFRKAQGSVDGSAFSRRRGCAIHGRVKRSRFDPSRDRMSRRGLAKRRSRPRNRSKPQSLLNWRGLSMQCQNVSCYPTLRAVLISSREPDRSRMGSASFVNAAAFAIEFNCGNSRFG